LEDYYSDVEDGGEYNEYLTEEYLSKYKKSTTDCEMIISHWVDDKNKMYVDFSDENFCLTGSDGGQSHWWGCDECDILLELNDK